MEKKSFICESCDEEYEVHWENDYDDPDYCPFCGEMILDEHDHDDDDDDEEEEDYDDFYSKLRHK